MTTQAAIRQRRKARHARDEREFRKKLLCVLITIVFVAALALVITTMISSSSAAGPKESVDDMNTGGIIKASAGTVDEETYYTDRDVEMIAKTVYGEALVTHSDTHMSYVVWCILNRVDAEGYGCGNSIEYVVTFPGQFVGYDESNPVDPHIEWLVRDVLNRWVSEKKGETKVGRTLAKDFLWFTGDGEYNTFRNAYDYDDAEYWIGAPITPYHN